MYKITYMDANKRYSRDIEQDGDGNAPSGNVNNTLKYGKLATHH